jgi:hypothetical protein
MVVLSWLSGGPRDVSPAFEASQKDGFRASGMITKPKASEKAG